MVSPIKLTRKSLAALAETIRPIEPHAARVAFVQRLLPGLYAGNPRFDAIRFVKACNVASLIDVWDAVPEIDPSCDTY